MTETVIIKRGGPPKTKTTEQLKKPMSVGVDDQTRDAVKAAALAEGISASTFVERAIKVALAPGRPSRN